MQNSRQMPCRFRISQSENVIKNHKETKTKVCMKICQAWKSICNDTFSCQNLHHSTRFPIFAMFPLQKPRKRRSEGSYILERRLLDALCLTLRNFANFNPVKDKATVDAHWDMLYSPYQAHLHSASVLIGVYIHISVGFCVARFDRMGNAKASKCGTGNR